MGTKNKKLKFKLLILLGFASLLITIFNSSNDIQRDHLLHNNNKSKKISNKKAYFETTIETEKIKANLKYTEEEIKHNEYNEIISCYPNVIGNDWEEVINHLSKNYPKVFEQKINRHYQSTSGKVYEYRLYIDREGNKDETLFEVRNELPFKIDMFPKVHLMKPIYDEVTTILINDREQIFESVKIDNETVFFEGFSENGILACDLDEKKNCLCSLND